MSRIGFPSVTNYEYRRTELNAGDALRRTSSGELLKGQVLQENSVVGRIASGANKGKFVWSLAAATDGSQVPFGILAYDVDATEDDAACEVFIAGDQNENALIIGAGHTLESVKAAFAGTPNFVKRVAGGAEYGGLAGNELP